MEWFLRVREGWLTRLQWLGPIALFLLVTGGAGYYAWTDILLDRAKWETDQLSLVSHIGELLTADLNQVSGSVQGLADWVAVRSGLSDADFDDYSRRMLERYPLVRSTTLLPDNRISRTYPLQPRLIGLDVGRHPEQGTAVREMMSRRAPLVTDVLQLAQSGSGLVVRAPVWIDAPTLSYFGHVSAVIDVDKLQAHLTRLGARFGATLSLRDADGKGTTRALKFGDDGSEGAIAVETKLEFLGETWLLSASDLPPAPKTQHGVRALFAAVLGAILAFALRLLLIAWAELRKQNRMLEDLASTDALTGIANRRVLTESGERAFALSRRTGFALSVLMLDLDHFKAVNDRYGHQAGDEVLRAIAKAASECLRSTDTLGRWGGEEFLILAPGTADDGASLLADRVLQSIRGLIIRSGEHEIRITASIGIAALSSVDTDLLALVERADSALYRAKSEGRDRAVISTPPTPEPPAQSQGDEGPDTKVVQMRRASKP